MNYLTARQDALNALARLTNQDRTQGEVEAAVETLCVVGIDLAFDVAESLFVIASRSTSQRCPVCRPDIPVEDVQDPRDIFDEEDDNLWEDAYTRPAGDADLGVCTTSGCEDKAEVILISGSRMGQKVCWNHHYVPQDTA